MKTKKIIGTLFFCLLPFFTHCGGTPSSLGGAEAGNPNRTVTGEVVSETTSSSLSLVKNQTTSCPADRVIAVNSRSENSIATIDSDCSFTLSLPTRKGYRLRFFSNDRLVARALFNPSTKRLASEIFLLSPGSSMNLGVLTISNGFARPEFEPAAQNDDDDDGAFDFDDEDDDGDDISDDDEEDCDLDGFFDDFDEDESCEEADETLESIIEVTPRNEDTASANEEIRVRTSCVIDQSTVDANSFEIADEDGNLLDCSFEFNDDGDRVECEHDGMSEDTSYTATVEGISCTNGTEIESESWSWTTEED